MKKDTKENISLCISLIVLIVVVLIAVGTFYLDYRHLDVVYEERLDYSKDVVALNDNLQTSGSINGHIDGNVFVISGTISGNINQEFVYAFYTIEADGAMKCNYAPASKVLIYTIEENEKPRIEKYVKQEILLSFNRASRMNSDNPIVKKVAYSNAIPCDIVDEHYKLYVPAGTIVTDMVIDLK